MTGLKAITGDTKGAVSFFVPLAKVDSDQRMVYGYASTDAKDADGETITLDALTAALPGYMKFANLREMHQLSAVGVAKSAEVDDKGLYLGGKIVDNDAWDKVKAGVYKGFSIGGTVTMRDPSNPKVITGLDLIEISVVDRPCNPDCLIDVWKAATNGPVRRPKQKWDCGIVGHDHAQKADALACIDDQTKDGTKDSLLLRARLIKAVDALDPEGLRAAVNALEKSQQPDPAEKGKKAEEDKADGDGHHEDAPQPPAPAAKAEDKDEEKVPKKGDRIAFANDKYTDKGPSSGEIVDVDGDQVKIDHSDVKADEFSWKEFDKPELKINDKGDRIWLIKCQLDDVTGQPDVALCAILGEGGSVIKTITLPLEPLEVEKAKKEDAKKDDAEDGDKKPEGDYGSKDDAGYADPGLQADKKPRYPLKINGKLSEKRIRAAWNYINKPKNAAQYSSAQVKEIKDRIIAAWKEAIDKDGPPSEQDSKSKAATTQPENSKMDRETLSKLGQPDAKAGFKKGLVAAASAIYLLDSLKDLQMRLARESALEGDDSSLPARLTAVVEMFAEVCQALLEEEVEEMLENKEIGDLAYPGCSPGSLCYAAPVVDLAKSAKGGPILLDVFEKTIGDRTGAPNFENLTKAIEDLVKKGQDEWSGSKPADDQGANNKWDSAPADSQGSNDKWPTEAKEAVQKIHDQAVKAGAVCKGDHKADAKKEDGEEPKDGKAKKEDAKKEDAAKGEKKSKKGDAEDGKNPPKPDASAGDDDGDEGGEGNSDDDGDEGGKKPSKSDAKKEDGKKSKKEDAASPLDETNALLKTLIDMVGKGASPVGRNPPLPGGNRTPVSKAEDGIAPEVVESVSKITDPRNATDEQKEAVLRAIRSRPNFAGR